MSFITLRASLTLETAFGTPLAGDTLFGQICWAVREQFGETELNHLLEGYTNNQPWLVVSDGFPEGYLPKPALPQFLFSKVTANLRKFDKAKKWIPCEQICKSLVEMQIHDESTAFGAFRKPVELAQSHNTLNRLTGSTGTGEFAPYDQQQIFYAQQQRMNVYFVLDETRMSVNNLQNLLQTIGYFGFGRDASIGLGKYTVNSCIKYELETSDLANAWLTLAPISPQGQGYDDQRSYWRAITRFGRHGNLYGVSQRPFKTPLLLASTASVFTPKQAFSPRLFIGQGIGGDGALSKVQPLTVHQGYAPVVSIQI
jgi:CRISPR-associated protein Csm4